MSIAAYDEDQHYLHSSATFKFIIRNSNGSVLSLRRMIKTTCTDVQGNYRINNIFQIQSLIINIKKGLKRKYLMSGICQHVLYVAMGKSYLSLGDVTM